jgi:hypothetical protein
MPGCKKTPKKAKHLRQESVFLLLFWHAASVALHSGTRFSAMPHIIPASQVSNRIDRVEIAISSFPAFSFTHQNLSDRSGHKNRRVPIVLGFSDRNRSRTFQGWVLRCPHLLVLEPRLHRTQVPHPTTLSSLPFPCLPRRNTVRRLMRPGVWRP